MDFWMGTAFGIWIGLGVGMFFQHHKEKRVKKEKVARYIAGVVNMSRSPSKEEVCGMLAEALDIKRRNLQEVWEEIKANDRTVP